MSPPRETTLSAPRRHDPPLKWTLISAVNNESVLKNCLLNSPDVGSASEVLLQTGYASAAEAYNAAIAKAKTELVVLVHQDVYLPEGWIASVQKACELLTVQDSHWGVLGVWGGTTEGGLPGHMYWTGVDGVAGRPFDGVLEVSTLDEVILILRKSSGLRFDERLPGYHLYGTDICLEARSRGMKCYAIPAFCIHNTTGYRMLPSEFWRNYWFIRRKWKSELPIASPCVNITFWCWPMFQWILVRAANILLGRHKLTRPVGDPSQLYQRMVSAGLVAAPCSDQTK